MRSMPAMDSRLRNRTAAALERHVGSKCGVARAGALAEEDGQGEGEAGARHRFAFVGHTRTA